MAQKYLHELLTEAQEPFLLKNYIADKQSKLRNTNSLTKKTKQFTKSILCNQSCFFSQTHSPNYTNSQFYVPSPAPVKNRAQLKITQFDLSLLLEAADKITNSNLGKTQKGNGGFGVFRSIIKKILKPGAKCEKAESLGGFVKNEDFEMDFGCSCSNNREKNGGESVNIDSDRFSLSEKCYCSSSVSTFLFSLQNSPSVYFRSPEYSSPATSPPEYSSPTSSPVISDIQGDSEVECVPKRHSEDEEKDQFSPVSILDPPFEDDVEKHENEEDEDDYNMECSYALVQRAKEQLLERLLRFEKLAKLDPIELERSILETKADDDDDEDDEELEDYKKDNSEKNFKLDMNRLRLISDLIAKGKRKGDGIDEGKIAEKLVCKKVGFGEKMDFKTKIDMILEFDLRREVGLGWKTNDQERLEETVVEIELSIFDLLVEELICEHVLWNFAKQDYYVQTPGS